ncbi:hypothetical protein [Nocardia sp. NPDC050412]|uniref:hypothetical protein n=1 Tax=unclassified Nocardia TaxID=2637762 RepID=UPI0037A0E1C9
MAGTFAANPDSPPSMVTTWASIWEGSRPPIEVGVVAGAVAAVPGAVLGIGADVEPGIGAELVVAVVEGQAGAGVAWAGAGLGGEVTARPTAARAGDACGEVEQ